MKMVRTKLSGLVLLAVVLSFFSGCTTCPQYASSESAENVVQTASSRNVKILWADSHPIDGRVIVHGTLERKMRGASPMTAHVDVQVLSASGEVLQEIQSSEISVPRNLPGKGIKFERFEVELDSIVTEPYTLVVSVHQGAHDGDDTSG